MDHTFVTRWGGRKGRYAEFRGAVGRCFDPFEARPIEFEKPIEYEGWLRERFNPATRSITPKKTVVSACINGREVSATVSFVSTKWNGLREFHLVAKNLADPNQRSRLARIAASENGKLVVTLLADLRADTALFWRLERLRQAAVLHFPEEMADLDSSILGLLHCGLKSRAQIANALPSAELQRVDAKLAYMHVAGRLVLDFASDDFRVSLPACGLR